MRGFALFCFIALTFLPTANAGGFPAAVTATGFATMVSGSSTCDVQVTLAIEGESRGRELSWPSGQGTGIVNFESSCWLFYVQPFTGGQSFEFGLGSCRVLEDRTAECWTTGDWDEPGENAEWGIYLRLDPDGTFHFHDFDSTKADGVLVRSF